MVWSSNYNQAKKEIEGGSISVHCLSDTHCRHNYIIHPDESCDLLLYAGDCCEVGTLLELQSFLNWIEDYPAKEKVMVAGNHDWPFMKNSKQAKRMVPDNVTYLIDDETEKFGYKIYGSPWQPEFCNWAFNLPRGEQLKQMWEDIPDDTDILLTHGPPYGILDKMPRGNVGDRELEKRIKDVDPDLHVFGHIHEQSGYIKQPDGLKGVYVNASFISNQENVPFSFELPRKDKDDEG